MKSSNQPKPESINLDWEQFDKNSEAMALLNADLIGSPSGTAVPGTYPSPLATPLATPGAFMYQTTTGPIGTVVVEEDPPPCERPLWVVEVRSLEREGWIAIPVFTGPDGKEWVCVFTARHQARATCDTLNDRYAIIGHDGKRVLTWRVRPYIRRE